MSMVGLVMLWVGLRMLKRLSYKTSSSQEFELYFTPSLEFLGSEPKFTEPTARPEGAARSTAAKLVSDPNNSDKNVTRRYHL